MSTSGRQIVYRPRPPVTPKGFPVKWSPNLSGFYAVTKGPDIVALYHPAYFLSAREVVADFLELLRSEEDWDCSNNDYVVWTGLSRVVAVVRWRAMSEEQYMEFPAEEEDKPSCAPWPHWPTREEWIERDRSDLWWKDDPQEEIQSDDRNA